MDNIIIVLKKDPALIESFKEAAVEADIPVEQFAGLTRHFMVQGMSIDDFPLHLAGHPAVEIVKQEEHELKAEAAQEVYLQPDGTGAGGWCAARVVRRNNPWFDPSQLLPRPSTFDCVRTGAGVDVYMIDSGTEYTHDEFGNRVSQCWHSSAGYASATLDNSGHGTHCLSLAMGRTVGIAREAQGHSMKFYNASGGAGSSNAIAAMGAILQHYGRTAADDRPAVMFFSWGGFGDDIVAAITDMIDAGIVCCFPAGNDRTDLGTVSVYPAEGDPDAIICGGINMADGPYYQGGDGTNWGNEVDILAPGQGTLGAQRAASGGGYRIGRGTSYATPLVAGVVACMLQGYKRLTTRTEVQALKAKLIANATTGKRTLNEGTQTELPDAILYLDPLVPFEVIEGLTPRSP